MFEIEAVDRRLGMKTREPEAPLDGTVVARLQFHIDQRFQRLNEAKVFGSTVSVDLVQMATHRRQAQLVQFLM